MTAASLEGNTSSSEVADRALRAAIALWFSTTLVGQWAFVVYIAAFYGRAAVAGRFETWNQVLVGGYVPGGTIGNLALGAHLFLALVITVGGPLQLVPRLRARAPRLHRWSGRVYVATAFVITLSGLYAVWTRGTAGGPWMRVGISGNGALIMVGAALAMHHARTRSFAKHRRWALRTFLIVSGVWFFRVGLMAWILICRGPVGVGDGFDGPFVRVWAFGCYLIPLAALEAVLLVERRGGATVTLVTAALVACLALATGAGVAGAALGMWLPHVRG